MWENNSKSTSIMRQISFLEKDISLRQNLVQKAEDVEVLFEFLNENQVEEDEVEKELNVFSSLIKDFELKLILNGENDMNDAIITIHPGAGGTERTLRRAQRQPDGRRGSRRRVYHGEPPPPRWRQWQGQGQGQGSLRRQGPVSVAPLVDRRRRRRVLRPAAGPNAPPANGLLWLLRPLRRLLRPLAVLRPLLRAVSVLLLRPLHHHLNASGRRAAPGNLEHRRLI